MAEVYLDRVGTIRGIAHVIPKTLKLVVSTWSGRAEALERSQINDLGVG